MLNKAIKNNILKIYIYVKKNFKILFKKIT